MNDRAKEKRNVGMKATPGADHGKIPENKGGRYLALMSLTALGVVYGDIGTSPLYALRVCFSGEFGVPVKTENILGALSLIFWSLILVITIKYLVFILKADNDGEGGILALMALAARPKNAGGSEAKRWTILALGLFGAALLYGDGMITPSISVLSAMEGLQVAAPVMHSFVEPFTIIVLIGLFLIQRKGTAKIGALFGPVMMVWFISLAVLGIKGIMINPHVLSALSPHYAILFFMSNAVHGFLALGAVFLVVTGGEALYADMGHFGRAPIRLGWFTIVLPSLLLNYFGQGALIITSPKSIKNPFFLLAPHWALYPLIVLSTTATIIASQAVISGSFSLTRQAVQLGFSPRINIRHTSSLEIGQIYVPFVNWTLMISTILLVIGFKTSDNLAAAYGVAVTTTMVITTLLFYVVAREKWGWPLWLITGISVIFIIADLSFFAANIIKVEHGGWFPLLVATVIFVVMTTWKRGREILHDRLSENLIPMETFIKDLEAKPLLRVPGSAVFMTGTPRGVPSALLHNVKHNRSLHEQVALLTMLTRDVPKVSPAERLEVKELGSGIYRIIAHYGFMETPSVPKLLKKTQAWGLSFDMMKTSFFLGRETLIPTKRPGMAQWREALFAFLSRNSQRATSFFDIPVNRVMELGIQIEL